MDWLQHGCESPGKTSNSPKTTEAEDSPMISFGAACNSKSTQGKGLAILRQPDEHVASLSTSSLTSPFIFAGSCDVSGAHGRAD